MSDDEDTDVPFHVDNTPTLDAWELESFVKESIVQHELEMCRIDVLPNASIVGVLLINVSVFMCAVSVLWSKPQLAFFYTPTQIVCVATIALLSPLRLMTSWVIRNLLVMALFMINLWSLAFAVLPFVDDCYRFYTFHTADHTLCSPVCFANTNAAVEFFSFFFACNSVAMSVFVTVCTYKSRACDAWY